MRRLLLRSAAAALLRGRGARALTALATLPLTPKPQRVAVVSSTSGGLGREFARQLAASGEYRVIGLTRAAAIQASAPSAAFETICGVDLEDPEGVLGRLPQEMQKLLGDAGRIDLLLNCSGVLGDGGVTTPGPERSTKGITPAWLEKTFAINTFGHVHVTNALLPWLTRGHSQLEPGRIVNISARVGSIGDNQLGGWYSYRMSKAALNMFTKTLAVELRRSHCLVLSIHPGTCDTALSKPFQKNVRPDKLFSAATAVEMMLQVALSRGMEHSGSFLDYKGEPIPW